MTNASRQTNARTLGQLHPAGSGEPPKEPGARPHLPGRVFSSRRAAAGGGDPGRPAESSSTTRSTKTLQGGVARPEILTKKFWPSGPRSNYFLLPPSRAGLRGGGCPLRPGVPTEGRAGGLDRGGAGTSRPDTPGACTRGSPPPGTGDWSKVPGSGGVARRAGPSLRTPKHAHPHAPRPAICAWRPAPTPRPRPARTRGRAQPPRSGQALAAAPAAAGETLQAGADP